jgi:membrane protein DedA with SNARE-associated domain
VRLGAAALVAAVPTYAAARGLTLGLGLGVEAAFVAAVVACLIGAAVFFGLARRMGVAELDQIRSMVMRRLRPG